MVSPSNCALGYVCSSTMVQTRICSYYKTRCTHVAAAAPATFLSLPEDLRDRIYLDAGVVTEAPLRMIGLSRELKDMIPPAFDSVIAAFFCITIGHGALFLCLDSDSYARREASELCFNLSISNRIIAADLARFLYLHNEIWVCCDDHTDLSVFLDLRPGLTKALRSLTIHLDTCSCHRHLDRCHQALECRDLQVHSLKSTSKRLRPLISLWAKVVDRLAVSANVSKLELKILCHVGDVTAARLIVEPLERIGLAPYAIRLGGTPNAELEDIASRAVPSPTRTKDFPFRFLDLPTEIRQYIFSYTDLVTPSRQIYCWGGARFHCEERRNELSGCTSGEFCARYHAVYPHCDCWLPPTPMFLVCKDMLQDARATFFALNQFIVTPRSLSSGIDERFEASIFLRKVVPREALSHLRSLEIIFPAILYDFFERDDEEFSGLDEGLYNHWVQTIEYIAPHLKRLELRLKMGYGDLRIAPSLWRGDEYFPGWQKELFLMHEQIVRPLWKLKCLSSFCVQATSPFNQGPIDSQQLRDHELRLETLVTGTGYNSVMREKSEPRAS